jgi:hypothetical protein
LSVVAPEHQHHTTQPGIRKDRFAAWLFCPEIPRIFPLVQGRKKCYNLSGG